MMLNHKQIQLKLEALNLQGLLRGSAVRIDDHFYKLLSSIKPPPKTIVEIGTYRGVATLMMATLADKVYTFDTTYQEHAEQIWKEFGVRHKIQYIIVDAYKTGYDRQTVAGLPIHEIIEKTISQEIANRKIASYLKNHDIQAGLTFIDAKHTYAAARKDHEITAQYGRTIFHDYAENYPGIIKLMKEIGAKIYHEFGYWENKNTLGK